MKLLTLLGIGFLATLIHCGGGDGRGTPSTRGANLMNLELILHPERISTLVGEDVTLKIRVTNRSSKTLTVPNPEVSANWPRMRLVNVKTKQERISSRATVSAGKTGDFRVPLPEATTTLEPGQSLEVSPSLSQLIAPPPPGSYELSCAIRWGSADSVESNVVPMAVAPLRVIDAEFFGAQSGMADDRFLLYSAETDSGAALFLSTLRNGGALPAVDPALRLATTGKKAMATLTVTAHSVVWPAQWVVWLDDAKLFGEYLMQWQFTVPQTSHAISSGSVKLVGPAFLDLKRAEGEKPAPGDVALVSRDGKKGSFEVRTLLPDGSLRQGPAVPTEDGEFLWGRAFYPGGEAERYVLAFSRGGGVDLRLISREEPDALVPPRTFGHLKGRHLSSGACTVGEEKLNGATLMVESLADGREVYRLFRWSVGRNGSPLVGTAIDLNVPKGVVFNGARLVVNEAENVRMALSTESGDWYSGDEKGKCVKLDPTPFEGRRLAGVHWAGHAGPLLLLSDPQTGLSFRPF